MHLTKLVMFAQNVSTQKDVTVDLSLANVDTITTLQRTLTALRDVKRPTMTLFKIAQLKSTKVELDKDVLI